MSVAVQATLDRRYEKADRPTIYFIGVTTGKSSIMTVFPRWAEHLGLAGAEIRGIDCKRHDDPRVYRRVVEFLRSDPLSLGALVTTHKIDLLAACRDLFDELDPFARLMGEVSGISKRFSRGDKGAVPFSLRENWDSLQVVSRGVWRVRLVGHAKDPISSGQALEAFLPPDHWRRTRAEVLVLGAGGSSIAITCYLMDPKHGQNRPSRILVTNRSTPRLREIEAIHGQLGSPVLAEYYHTPTPEDNDALVGRLSPHSLVVNATGLGKDAPGSPITSLARFPEQGYAWDFNYRGDLVFLDQARAAQTKHRLHVEDGWIYFLHGWIRVISEVFDLRIPVRGPEFDTLAQIAAEVRLS